jgi:hypothetical protein
MDSCPFVWSPLLVLFQHFSIIQQLNYNLVNVVIRVVDCFGGKMFLKIFATSSKKKLINFSLLSTLTRFFKSYYIYTGCFLNASTKKDW